jgi:hypothetical protein
VKACRQGGMVLVGRAACDSRHASAAEPGGRVRPLEYA